MTYKGYELDDLSLYFVKLYSYCTLYSVPTHKLIRMRLRMRLFDPYKSKSLEKKSDNLIIIYSATSFNHILIDIKSMSFLDKKRRHYSECFFPWR